MLITVALVALTAIFSTVAGQGQLAGRVHVRGASQNEDILGPLSRRSNPSGQPSYNTVYNGQSASTKVYATIQAAMEQKHPGSRRKMCKPGSSHLRHTAAAGSCQRSSRQRLQLVVPSKTGPNMQQQQQQQQQRGQPHVILVNDLPGHYEVLAGLIHLLHTSGVRYTTLYVGSDSYLKRSGFVTWLDSSRNLSVSTRQTLASQKSFKPAANGQLVSMDAATGAKKGEVSIPAGLRGDMVICVSPELGKNECRLVVKKVQPRFLVMFVHRAERVSFKNGPLHIPGVRRTMVALAPHVASACRTRSGQATAWMLPTAPFAANGMQQCKSRSCLQGFVVQGTIRSYSNRLSKGLIRNYSALWTDLLHVVEQEGPETAPAQNNSMPLLHIKVLGKGVSSKLGIPSALEDYVVHLPDLPYPEFWHQIHRSLALLPCFGMEEYYRSRLSSTIIASIVTSTPLIADERLLEAYTFLQPKHVFLRHDGESKAQAMVRVLALPDDEVFSRRIALQQLRDQLNAGSRHLLASWLQPASQ